MATSWRGHSLGHSAQGQAGDRLITSSSKLGSHRKCFTCFSRCPVLQVARHRLSWLHRQSRTGPARMRGRPRVARGQAKVRKAARAAVGSLRASLAAEPARMQARAFCFGYGLKTCRETVTRGRCNRGLHICAWPRCGKSHPALDCPLRAEALSQKQE